MKRAVITFVLLLLGVCQWASAEVPPMNARLTGSELAIASNDGEGKELCFRFYPCMANRLFSFSHVGLREVSRTTSDCVGLANDKTMSWLNIASSDNIGPVAVKGYYNYVGGNHLWKKADSNGNRGRGKQTSIFTARCDSFTVCADGVPLSEKTYTSCRKITINVWNTLFDPLVNPEEGATMLSSPLIYEHVTYTVEHNTINVTVEHKYLKNCTISRYNGMQSMFRNEVSIMTPDGVYTDWTANDSVYRFARKEYPKFSHFIERNASGWCQTTLLYPTDLGNHDFLPENYAIFLYTSYKCYHVVMCNKTVAKGEVRKWEGSYVWCLPDIDDSFLTVTRGVRNGRTLLILDVKQAGTYAFERPKWWSEFDVLVPGQGLEISETDGRVTIISAKPTSTILLGRTPSVYMRGDLNGDGMVDVADISLLIDLVLGRDVKPVDDGVCDLIRDGKFDVSDVNALVDIVLRK